MELILGETATLMIQKLLKKNHVRACKELEFLGNWECEFSQNVEWKLKEVR